jgi:hypothetical protein
MKALFTTVLSLFLALNYGFAQQSPETPATTTNEVERLMQVLTNETYFKTNPELAAKSIGRLGELKAVAVIPLLIVHIDFYDPRDNLYPPTRPYTILSRRIAVDALIKIGKPSIEPVLQAGRKEDDQLRIICIAGVIRGIEGLEGGQRLLEKTAAAVRDSAEKECLKKLTDYVSNPPVY